MTHNSPVDKESVTTTWIAPPAGTGPVHIGYGKELRGTQVMVASTVFLIYGAGVINVMPCQQFYIAVKLPWGEVRISLKVNERFPM